MRQCASGCPLLFLFSALWATGSEGAPCAPLSFHSGEEHVRHGSGAAGLPTAPVHAGTEASFAIYSRQHPRGVRGPIDAENAAQAAAEAAAGLGFAQGRSLVI